MKCPKCGSERTHYVTNTRSTGPSITNGCCGWIILGPVGLLCSFCGMGSETEEYWICDECGKKFHAEQKGFIESIGEIIEETAEEKKENERREKEEKEKALKREIQSLEKFVENNPENLDEQLEAAKQEYETWDEKYTLENGKFIASSSRLYFWHKVNYWSVLLAFFSGLVCVGSFIYALFSNNTTPMVISGMGIIWFIIQAILSDAHLKKVKRKVDLDKALELETMQQEVKEKKKIYENYKEMKEKAESLVQKQAELQQSESISLGQKDTENVE